MNFSEIKELGPEFHDDPEKPVVGQVINGLTVTRIKLISAKDMLLWVIFSDSADEFNILTKVNSKYPYTIWICEVEDKEQITVTE